MSTPNKPPSTSGKGRRMCFTSKATGFGPKRVYWEVLTAETLSSEVFTHNLIILLIRLEMVLR